MNTQELLEQHKQNIQAGKPWSTDFASANLSGANLRSANLHGANLPSANLPSANLSGAHLRSAYLSSAYLRSANLSSAYLRGADLSGADLRGADLSGADLRGANLSGANLRSANLSGANLRSANLSSAYLRSANLSGANLHGADLDKITAAKLSILPSDGDIVGWKKCRNNTLVKLLVKESTPRSNAVGRKCRAAEVEVLAIEGADVAISGHDQVTEYRVGETVECDKWDGNRWVECTGGIHFFLTRAEAEAY